MTDTIPARFALLSRLLHWLMAAMVLAMLFIGVAMVSSLHYYHRLISVHRPLGILILGLVIVRWINRKLTTLPPFPPTMPEQERKVAHYSELLLYGLLFILPIVGWAMLSAGHYPIVLVGSLHLPPILPASPKLFWLLRKTHTVLAYVLFGAILAHLAGVLFHQLVIRDRILDRMSVWNRAKRQK